MFRQPPREGPKRSWLFFALWVGVIFSAIPLARAIQSWVAGHWGSQFLRWFSIAVIAVAASLAAAYVTRGVRKLPWRNILWLAATVAVFSWLAVKQLKTAAEAVHFVEYGLLGLLAFRALSHRLRDRLVYVASALLCALVGLVDEIVQWTVPGRYWDPRDITLNSTAAILAQVALAGGIRPPFIRPGSSARSVRRCCALAATILLLVGLCASNTPYAVAWYGERVPLLAFLRENHTPMSEYGYEHKDPDIGVFYSRFRLEDLANADATRGEDAGRIIRHYRSERTYQEFLRDVTPASDPFTHEAMVHLFRRDHYNGVRWKYRSDDAMYRLHSNVAYRENLILERFYPRTLAAAQAVWPEELKADLAAWKRTDRVYRSAVSKHLITNYSERQVWMILLLLLALCGATAWRWGRESRSGGAGA